AGYGHVEFTTPDAAQKAIELNGSDLLGREVKIDLAKERGERGERSAYTPGGNDRSYQKSGGQGQGLSVFVRGFGEDNDFDSLRATLEGHFGGCGEIARLSIPKDYESGGPKGIAFIDFADSNGFNKALEL
nr:nucleolin 1 isoform X1 [Tanacetum cinerariifolium]